MLKKCLGFKNAQTLEKAITVGQLCFKSKRQLLPCLSQFLTLGDLSVGASQVVDLTSNL